MLIAEIIAAVLLASAYGYALRQRLRGRTADLSGPRHDPTTAADWMRGGW